MHDKDKLSPLVSHSTPLLCACVTTTMHIENIYMFPRLDERQKTTIGLIMNFDPSPVLDASVKTKAEDRGARGTLASTLYFSFHHSRTEGRKADIKELEGQDSNEIGGEIGCVAYVNDQ